MSRDAGAVGSVLVRLNARSIGRLLAVIIVTLTVLSLVVNLAQELTGIELKGIQPLLNLNGEANLPTFFSSVQLLFAAACTAAIALTERHRDSRSTGRWWALAVLLVYMSVDEAAQLHEKFSAVRLVVSWLPDIIHSWVLLGTIFALAVGAYFLPFLIQLPLATRWGYIASGGVFLLGAVGVEVFEGLFYLAQGEQSILLTTLQEFLELGSIAYFIVVSLKYAKSINVQIDVQVD